MTREPDLAVWVFQYGPHAMAYERALRARERFNYNRAHNIENKTEMPKVPDAKFYAVALSNHGTNVRPYMSHYMTLEQVASLSTALRSFIPDELFDRFPKDNAPFHPIYTFVSRDPDLVEKLGPRPIRMVDDQGYELPTECAPVNPQTLQYVRRKASRTTPLLPVKSWDETYKDEVDSVVHAYFNDFLIDLQLEHDLHYV